MVPEHKVKEQLDRLVGRHFCFGWSKMDHLAETIDEDENPGVAFGVTWKVEDEVHADGSPRARGDGQWAKRSLLGRGRLDTLTDNAGTDPLPYPLVHARPEKVTRKCCERLLAPEMTAGGCVVILMPEAIAKVVIGGDDDARRVECVDGVCQKVAVEVITRDCVTRWARHFGERVCCRITQIPNDRGIEGIFLVGVSDMLTQRQDGT
ncbi:unnamed protein product [Phytophthora fragariaefolia]|uniref:Unnamed protein product n=1 Tax=Phytophthora fragariaefolia TaxID=1490495 RepID=A0A9W6UA44_9STRA|nr:unnamed protein product [Phytophthora fragariaefolia]